MALLQDTQIIKPLFNSIPQEMKACRRWILWKAEFNMKKGELDKVPYHPKGFKASSTNETTWITFDEAVKAYENGEFDGIGFVLGDGWVGIDIDNCINENGEASNLATEIISAVDSYYEKSVSGTGVHIIVKAEDLPDFKKKVKKPEEGFPEQELEMYDGGRYFTITGKTGYEKPVREDATPVIKVIDEHLKKEDDPQKPQNQVIQLNMQLSDEEVKRRMFEGKNGDIATRLFEGDTIDFANDDSRADQSLCSRLAFWTAKDPDQMDRIFRQSGLYREDKWNKVHNSKGDTYGEMTINFAIQETNNVYTPRGENNGEIIPKPFLVKYGSLYKTVVKSPGTKNEMEVDIFISRKVPFLTKEFNNVERPQIFYEIEWKDKQNKTGDVVPASTISVKKDLLELSNKGFSVNDNNAKNLIQYFDSFLTYNDIERAYAVERLGEIKGQYIHPVMTENVEILAVDNGEKQIKEAFQVKGSFESWKREVFDRIKLYPKAVFYVLASFASVVIKDLGIKPFIVDLSGSTSQGKTTTAKASTTVWGSDDLMHEWNATRVSIERKASYLNSYPLIMDDTRKANEWILKDIIYQFSGGRSKGRGTPKGSQREYTWQNILLSTGEASLNEYAKSAGGAAARIIPINDQPLGKDHDNIMALHEAMDNNYGAAGIEFLKAWMDRDEDTINEFKEVSRHFYEQARGQEVLTRLAGYYAAVYFTGSFLREQLDLDVDLGALMMLFDQIADENKDVDKPMQFLEVILTELDSNPDQITGNYKVVNKEVLAVYKENQSQLYLMPAFVKRVLGTEEKGIRKEWLKRGITMLSDKNTDYRQVKHDNKNWKGIPVNMDHVEELGFDFTEI